MGVVDGELRKRVNYTRWCLDWELRFPLFLCGVFTYPVHVKF
jgi:hypothetical protein